MAPGEEIVLQVRPTRWPGSVAAALVLLVTGFFGTLIAVVEFGAGPYPIIALGLAVTLVADLADKSAEARQSGAFVEVD